MFLLIPICGLTYGSGFSVVILAAAMFVPALCNVLTRLITKEGFKNMYLRPHFKGHMRDYLLVYFGAAALLFLGGAVYFLIFPSSFDPELTVLKGLVASGGKQGLTASTLLIVQILIFVINKSDCKHHTNNGGGAWLERIFAPKIAHIFAGSCRVSY